MRSKKRVVRYSLLGANLALLLAVVIFVSSGPNPIDTTKRSSLSAISEGEVINPLDKLSSADIAVHVARMTRLDEAVSVANHADSVNAEMILSEAEESIATKPQIVATELKSKRDIIKYKTQEGDTVSSIAKKFGVNSDSIRWSNGLSGDELSVGKTLFIPPVNGIVYKVQEGDTVESIASRYSANKQKIIQTNDAELAGLKVGELILIPDGIQPTQRSYYSYYGGFAWGGSSPVYKYNGYDYGQCTWHAANRRREIGKPIPSNLGDARSWYSIAAWAGLPTGSQPKQYAVLWHQPGYKSGYLGHVAFVERVNSDGSILVSDMNYGGSYAVPTTRTISPSEFSHYRFIY